MFPLATKGDGQCFAMPDVCKTPAPPAPSPVPIPYPNMAMCQQASDTSTKVLICKKEAITTQSSIPQSQGDEAGVAGGVVSGANMGKVTFKKGSQKIQIEGHPAVLFAATTGQNGSQPNATGAQITPSQTKVLGN